MTAPNKPAKSDILAARAIVKARNHPAHYGAIDAGDWDDYSAIQSALAELIRKRNGEDENE